MKNIEEIKFVVSLTTYGKRIKTVSETINSLINQTIKPTKIILWLDEMEFTSDTIPDDLKNLVSRDFEVKFCTNLRSYKKLVPTLSLYPDTTIITVDDDFKYPKNLFSELLAQHVLYPNHIVAGRGRVINIQDKEIQSYSSWKRISLTQPVIAKHAILPIGYSGILYPPRSLHPDATNSHLFNTLAPYADDLWFKAMAMLNNTPTIVLASRVMNSLKPIADTQDIGLYNTHNAQDGNTKQMKAISEHYPDIRARLNSRDFYTYEYPFNELVDMANAAKVGKHTKDTVHEIIRAAISYEKSDISMALKLMLLAKKVKPLGPMVVRKVKEYNGKVNVDKSGKK